MQDPIRATIIRHRRENLKKCSLQPLVHREDLEFIRFPMRAPLTLPTNTLILSFEGAPLSERDAGARVLLLDGTWQLAEQMERHLAGALAPFEKRALPPSLRTAYPRRQTGCFDPLRGLASLEALYAAFLILGYPTEGMLDHYHWREAFSLHLKETLA